MEAILSMSCCNLFCSRCKVVRGLSNGSLSGGGSGGLRGSGRVDMLEIFGVSGGVGDGS